MRCGENTRSRLPERGLTIAVDRLRVPPRPPATAGRRWMAMRGRRRPVVVQRLVGAFVVLFVAAPRALAVPLGEGGSLKGIADDELAPSVSWVDSARRLHLSSVRR